MCSSDLVIVFCFFFFFKQKTAYEIYQCDWSSDVCSSDLVRAVICAYYEFAGKLPKVIFHDQKVFCFGADNNGNVAAPARQFLYLRIHTRSSHTEIGRASCRERV